MFRPTRIMRSIAEYLLASTAARWAARRRATFSRGVSLFGPGWEELGGEGEDGDDDGCDEGVDLMFGREAG